MVYGGIPLPQLRQSGRREGPAVMVTGVRGSKKYVESGVLGQEKMFFTLSGDLRNFMGFFEFVKNYIGSIQLSLVFFSRKLDLHLF